MAQLSFFFSAFPPVRRTYSETMVLNRQAARSRTKPKESLVILRVLASSWLIFGLAQLRQKLFRRASPLPICSAENAKKVTLIRHRCSAFSNRDHTIARLSFLCPPSPNGASIWGGTAGGVAGSRSFLHSPSKTNRIPARGCPCPPLFSAPLSLFSVLSSLFSAFCSLLSSLPMVQSAHA